MGLAVFVVAVGSGLLFYFAESPLVSIQPSHTGSLTSGSSSYGVSWLLVTLLVGAVAGVILIIFPNHGDPND
jgi:hypothetical protein